VCVFSLRVLSTPLRELNNQIVSFEGMLLPAAGHLVEDLRRSTSLREQNRSLDRFARRAGANVHDEVAHGLVERIIRDGGQASIGDMAWRAGIHERRLRRSFAREVGLSPKTLSRIFRFRRALKCLRSSPRLTCAEVAVTCGYCDQAHMNRDFRQFSGRTPAEFAEPLSSQV
jgi:transcriptional regulator GlxA family with amidase domain